MELLDIEKKQYESWSKFRAFCIWYPDLYLDAVTPDEGRIVLDFDQRVFLRAQLRFFSVYGVMPRSWSKCITGDSIIYTDKGMIEIGSLFNYSKPEDEIITEHDINILNRYGKKEHTKLGISNGKRKTKKIVSNFGYSIEGTLNHPLLTIGEDGVIDFKKIEDFKVGDKIIINRKNNIFGTETEDYPYYFGRVFGKSKEKEIPKNIMKSSKKTVIEFVKGLYHSNGYIDRKNKKTTYWSDSEKLISQLQIILLNFGVLAKKTKEEDIFSLEIFDENHYDFFQKEYFEYSGDSYFYDTIVSIEDSENYVYDIQTEETHSFISNGFVSHNTFLEALAMFLVAIFYPNTDLAMSAQTKENAASILGAKIMEIKRYWPILNNEIRKLKIDKNEISLILYNNSTISILANAQTSKGQRRHRLNVEESALLNNELFLDVLEPIPAMPRRTSGKLGIKNPYELNGQINFFTTAGFRGSDEFLRLNSMIDDMAELNGRFVMTADWQLACWFGRGPTKEQMLKKKEENSALSFAQNYDSIWAGAGDGSLVSPNKLFNSRKIEMPLFDNKDNRELYLAVDVARSEKDNNNQNALAILEAVRDESGMLKHIDLVNMFVLSGTATFTELALYTKQLFFNFNCAAVIIDSNGLGNGLRDELLKESKDDNGKVYPCFVTFNTEAKPDTSNYVRVMFDLKPQSANTDVIVSFIDAVESGQLRLLVQKNLNEYDVATGIGYEEKVLPYLNTDLFIEEVSNLKLKQNGAGKGYSVVKNLSKIDKDRWAATAYGIWFIRTFKYSVERKTTDLTDYIIATKKQKRASQPMIQKIQRRKSRFFDR